MESGKVIKLQPDAKVNELTPPSFSVTDAYNKYEMVVVNGKMFKIVEEASRIAPFNINVLISGESGVGKEELARLIHKKSGRQGPFIAVNCAALPENLVESELFGHRRGAFTSAISDYKGKLLMADRGTLFLDEIGDMRQDIQAKLLQVLDQRNFGKERYFYPIGSEAKAKSDFRIICASNQDIEGLVEGKKFRQDLFFRLNVARFHIPPLRERPEEIPILAQHILQKIVVILEREHLYFSPKCLEFISGLKWPGNVRELQNSITRAAALIEENRKVIEVKYFKELIPAKQSRNYYTTDLIEDSSNLDKNTDENTRKTIIEALESCDWILVRAAQRLGITRRRIKYQIDRLGIVHPLGKWKSNSGRLNGNTKEVSKEERKVERPANSDHPESKHEKTPIPPQDFNQEKDAENNKTPCAPANEVMSKNKKRFDKELLIDALEQNSWSQTKTAQSLKTSRPYVSFLVKKWGIKPPGGSWRKSQASNEIGIQSEPEAEPEEKKSAQARQSADQPPATNQELAILKGARYSKEALIRAFETHDWSKTKMAAALKIGYQSVGTLVKKMDIKPPDGIWGRKPEYTKEKLELILKENDWNQTRAAVALGITQARLSALAKNRGVVAPEGIWQKREQKTRHLSKEELTELFEKNDWSQRKVAAKIGIKQSSVSYLCTTRGIIPPSGSWKKNLPKKPTALEIILGKPWPDNK